MSPLSQLYIQYCGVGALFSSPVKPMGLFNDGPLIEASAHDCLENEGGFQYCWSGIMRPSSGRSGPT